MPKFFWSIILLASLAGVAGCARRSQPVPSPIPPPNVATRAVSACPPDRPVKNISIIQENGGRMDWSPDGKLIVFDRQNADGYFDLYVMTPEGKIVTSLTEGNPSIAQRHNGNPAWHPSGKFIVFESEADKHYNAPDKWPGNPGIGVYANLWAITPDGTQTWKLTDVPIKQTLTDGLVAMGTLNPHFSRDGSKLVWTERFADGGRWGKWRVRMADFIAAERAPHLANDRVVIAPAGKMGAYITAMDFSPDASQLLLAGNLDGQDEFGMDQYIYDLKTGALKNLQNSPEIWEEDASWSPDGARIVYMTNLGSPMDFKNPDWYWQKRTREYWMMDADGSRKQPLTCFNIPGSPEYIPQGAIVAASSFSPDGKWLAGIVGVDYGTKDKADYRLKIGLIAFK
jgi:Tol biopolymer transport system component